MHDTGSIYGSFLLKLDEPVPLIFKLRWSDVFFTLITFLFITRALRVMHDICTAYGIVLFKLYVTMMMIDKSLCPEIML